MAEDPPKLPGFSPPINLLSMTSAQGPAQDALGSRHKVVGEVSEIRRVLTTPQRDTVTHTVILPTIQRAPRAGCAVKSSTVLYCTYLLKRFYNMSWLVPFSD